MKVIDRISLALLPLENRIQWTFTVFIAKIDSSTHPHYILINLSSIESLMLSRVTRLIITAICQNVNYINCFLKKIEGAFPPISHPKRIGIDSILNIFSRNSQERRNRHLGAKVEIGERSRVWLKLYRVGDQNIKIEQLKVSIRLTCHK